MNPIPIIFIVVGIAGVAFLLCFLTALCRDKKGPLSCADSSMAREGREGAVKTQSFNAERRGNTPRLTSRKGKWAAVIAICAAAISLRAQTTTPVEAAQAAQCAQAMQVPPDQLKTGVSELNAK